MEENEVKKAFSETLKRLRKSKGLSQEELAKELGISKGAVSYYETAQRSPDAVSLSAFADYFGVTIDRLLGRDELKLKEKHVDELTAKTIRLNELLKEASILIDLLTAGKNNL